MTHDEVADFVRTLLKSGGTTQTELAKVLNLSQSTLSLYASGARRPSLGVCERIAEHYGYAVLVSVVPDDEALRNRVTSKLALVAEQDLELVERLADLLPHLEPGARSGLELQLASLAVSLGLEERDILT